MLLCSTLQPRSLRLIPGVVTVIWLHFGYAIQMTALRNQLNAFAEQIEQMKELDAPASFAQHLVRSAIGSGRAGEILSGEPLGHPLHPALVAVPTGAWLSASLLDLTGGNARAARRLVGLGIVTALPTAASGAHDWSTTEGEVRRVGFVHALLNDTALLLYGASWLARRRNRRLRGAVLSLAGAGVLSTAGWLGGHLVFVKRVGVTDWPATEHAATEHPVTTEPVAMP